MLSIGQVAKQAGIKVETVRFYEREALIKPPARAANGYRQYTPETVRRIHFIRHAKVLGFTLAEIGELLSLKATADASCAEVQTRTEAKIADIETRIESLSAMKAALLKLVQACHGDTPASECPILEAIDNNDEEINSGTNED